MEKSNIMPHPFEKYWAECAGSQNLDHEAHKETARAAFEAGMGYRLGVKPDLASQLVQRANQVAGIRMQDLLEAENVEISIDAAEKLWVNVNNVCALRIGKVATLQLDFDPQSHYAAKGKHGIYLRRKPQS